SKGTSFHRPLNCNTCLGSSISTFPQSFHSIPLISSSVKGCSRAVFCSDLRFFSCPVTIGSSSTNTCSTSLSLSIALSFCTSPRIVASVTASGSPICNPTSMLCSPVERLLHAQFGFPCLQLGADGFLSWFWCHSGKSSKALAITGFPVL